jgi:muramidase (phage lysozyme)
MRDAIALAGLLREPNVQAFLRVIRAGEGTADDDGYRRQFGGKLFNSFADHPRDPVTARLGKPPRIDDDGNFVAGGQTITSTAAGAYQFLARTWDGLVKQHGFRDFEPRTQDIAALALIDGRGALDDVLAGRVEQAITKCNREWASLPGSPYGQPTRTMAQALAVFAEFDGRSTKEQPTMPLPFIAAALPMLIEAAPALIRLFGNSPQAEKNAKAAEAVADIAKTVTGQPTVEGAVAAIQGDPSVAAQFRERVHLSMGELLGLLVQASESDDKSRDKAADRALMLSKETGGKWLYLLGFIAVMVVAASYGITWRVMFGDGSTISDETKALLLGQIVIFGFVTVLGFLFGSNIQNRIRDTRE